MPTIPDIKTSIENKNVLVIDQHARQGTFEEDDRGRLLSYAGGFSVVFPYRDTSGQKWAFRCWHSAPENSPERYEKVATAIKTVQLPFLCAFEYINQAINVEGKTYPATRMKWIDGKTLKDYICQNRSSKILLAELAQNFLAMTQEMHTRSLAHGDLQQGNILIGENNQLFLVDYDSFYCPALKGEADTVTGLPDFQHPARSRNKKVSEKIDYFSELIIYLSILAIAENPTLVDKYQVEKADRLLFSKEDYVDLKNAPIYQDIQRLGADFQELLQVLETYLAYSQIDDLAPFESYTLNNKVAFSVSTQKAVRNSQEVAVTWDVPFEAEVVLRGASGKQIGRGTRGKLSTFLAEDTTFELVASTKWGGTIKKQLEVKVFDQCEIAFSADKYNVFPSLPVVLTWSVKHASKVWLDDEAVESKGQKTVEPIEPKAYKLKVEDAFGTSSKEVKINMLPTPIIKSIMVPTPQLSKTVTIQNHIPRLHIEISNTFHAASTPKLNLEMPKWRTIDVKQKKFGRLNVGTIIPGNSLWNRLQTAIRIVENKIDRLKFEYDGK